MAGFGGGSGVEVGRWKEERLGEVRRGSLGLEFFPGGMSLRGSQRENNDGHKGTARWGRGKGEIIQAVSKKYPQTRR